MSNQLNDFTVWLTTCRVRRNRTGYSPRTIQTYVSIIQGLLKRRDKLGLFKDQTSSTNTRKVTRAALLRWADFTEDEDLKAEVLALQIDHRGARPVRRTLPYTSEEMNNFYTILDLFKDRPPLWLWPAVRVFTVLGLRAAVDLCGLQKAAAQEALRTEKLQIWTKTEKRQVLPAGWVGEELQQLVTLRNWRIMADLISPQTDESKREQAAYRTFTQWLKEIGKLAGMDPKEIQSRRFRCTAATSLYKDTKDLHLVQMYLGHASPETTIVYLGEDRLDEIDAALGRIHKEKDHE